MRYNWKADQCLEFGPIRFEFLADQIDDTKNSDNKEIAVNPDDVRGLYSDVQSGKILQNALEAAENLGKAATDHVIEAGWCYWQLKSARLRPRNVFLD